jgi:hypothetical protein
METEPTVVNVSSLIRNEFAMLTSKLQIVIEQQVKIS